MLLLCVGAECARDAVAHQAMVEVIARLSTDFYGLRFEQLLCYYNAGVKPDRIIALLVYTTSSHALVWRCLNWSVIGTET